MEPIKIGGVNARMTLDYKGGSIEISDTIPDISRNEDYFKQYIGIWRVMFDRVIEIKAQKVVEFGTREGYSTRLFAKALKITGGSLTTIDMIPCKESFDEDNITVATWRVEDCPIIPCDILYIDDWHDGYHLYYELNKFSASARVIMIHDICLDGGLVNAVHTWCVQNMMIYTIYPMNGCGLAVIEREKSLAFYTNKDKTTGE